MIVDVRNLQEKVKIDKKEIKKCAGSVLEMMDEARSELSILVVSDSRIRDLNRRYRGKDSSTDVLAFSMRAGEGVSKDSPILGDVVISAETAKREAAKRKIPVKKEICLYVIHGILHLLGYRDQTPYDRKKMKAKERALLEAV
ncbi:MAG: rRNA maturation RNase YbeY [Candidatus Omnitrophica bacterium]|nr:rRNA maturation RNase YbeY [Candidatus Omnitrophota bacterium]MBU1933002.1 rRNA maturation RNase YbeY [Candidatus Omnitrophota bacterium]